MNKPSKWGLITFAVLFAAYVGWVVEFEYSLGTNQPMGGSAIVIATFNADNERHERVLSLRKINGNDYVAANHWPRAWYNQALVNPNVEVKMAGSEEFVAYLAVPLEGEEDALLREEYALSFRARAQMGFPPRYFLRLDPRQESRGH
ncbi:MAG TPA: hypothetical protein DCM64_08440 [Gammaproteobacteria bacterium]|nr:hypothetical protein [Gammaproteobacteria bacterium]MDP6731445.1 hypothetical protein [Gammaproteobacteria bacterium]HAJ76473.1 hypothetical protein [Gammaproteobacteria bacterium]